MLLLPKKCSNKSAGGNEDQFANELERERRTSKTESVEPNQRLRHKTDETTNRKQTEHLESTS